MGIIDALHQELEQEAVRTRKLFERVPDDRFNWRPHPKSMSLGRLAGHIAELPKLACSALDADELDLGNDTYRPFVPASRQELLAFYEKALTEALAAMGDRSDAHLMEPWRFRQGERIYFELPRLAVLRGMVLNHIIHHRGQLTVYLRLNDVPLPMVFGPTADESGM